MQRPLSDRGLAVLELLTTADRPEAAPLHDSLPFLVVDDECDCGCESFGVHDIRYAQQGHELESWVDAHSRDGDTQLGLLLGSERRLKYLEIFLPDQGRLPAPDHLVVLPQWLAPSAHAAARPSDHAAMRVRPADERAPAGQAQYSPVMVEGTVRFWRDEKGWGVIDSPETPGGCWAHFSFVEASAYRTLAEGQPVELEWEVPQNGIYEGYRYFATRVVPRTH